ncbi:MAG: ABC transporter substrate-binding protein [Treponema sp.]|nr:ABC transporter substrate-binding protein [Treponema sp.]
MEKKVMLIAAVLLLSVNMLFAGGQQGGAQQSGTQGGAAAALEKESPRLAQQVRDGKLPPLEQRIPKASDVMVEPMESTGAYGDHLTMVFRGKGEQWVTGKITEEPLVRFTADGQAAIEPNVAKSWTVNSNSTEYTIKIREGIKWSDGVPFTSDDCIFFYEHMVLPKSFGNSVAGCFYSTDPKTLERTLCTMTKVDDYTFKVNFKDPAPLFLEKVAIDTKWMFAPAHWMKDYLPEYIGEAAADAKAKELGYANGPAMNREVGYYYWNIPGRPTLRPWIAVTPVDSDLHIQTRNPYYWKVDAEGRQLPYIDELRFERIADDNQKLLKAMSGETDVAIQLPYASITALQQNSSRSGYRLVTWDSAIWSAPSGSLQFNLTAKDPKLRALFENKEFRHAMSIAADRKEMVNLVTDGFAKPAQASPPEGTMGYSRAWAEKWTEYNPQEAKRLLEQSCGLKMGRDGYYTYADGSPLSLEIMSYDDRAETARSAELLTEKYFKNIGIKASFTVRTMAYIDQLNQTNDLTAVLAPVRPQETINLVLRPGQLVPVDRTANYSGEYGRWYESNGTAGQEPKGDVLKIQNLYREAMATAEKAGISRIALEMLKILEDNVWQVGYFTDPPVLMAVNSDLKNFPDKRIWCDEFRHAGFAHFANFYFSKDKK